MTSTAESIYNLLGSLVRPRRIITAKYYSQIVADKPLYYYSSTKNPPKIEDCFAFYNLLSSPPTTEKNKIPIYRDWSLDLKNLFSDLNIGKLSDEASLETAYVGVIESILISIGFREYILVNKENFKEKILENKNLHRRRFYAYAAGIKFYKGMKLNEEGKFEAINPWDVPSSKTESEPTQNFFYGFYDILPIENIICFEQVKKGDMLNFKHSSSLVIRTRTMKKKYFYHNNSWTAKVVKLFSPMSKNGRKKNAFYNLLPGRRFIVHDDESAEMEKKSFEEKYLFQREKYFLKIFKK